MSQIIKIADWTGETRANAVFVHGLGGHAYDTWQRWSIDESFWPLWLAEDVKGLTVYTLSYAAPPSNWLGTAMPLQDRAVNVLECLLGEPGLRRHPITFICHSLGGLPPRLRSRRARGPAKRRSATSAKPAAPIIEHTAPALQLALRGLRVLKTTWRASRRLVDWRSAMLRWATPRRLPPRRQ